MKECIKKLLKLRMSYLPLLAIIAFSYVWISLIQRALFALLLPYELLSYLAFRLWGYREGARTVYNPKYPLAYLIKYLFYTQIRARTWGFVFNLAVKKSGANLDLKALALGSSKPVVRYLVWGYILGIATSAFPEICIWAEVLVDRAYDSKITWADSIGDYIGASLSLQA